MNVSENKRIRAALDTLLEAMRDENLNGNCPAMHASVLILQKAEDSTDMLVASIAIGCDCPDCYDAVAQAASINAENAELRDADHKSGTQVH